MHSYCWHWEAVQVVFGSSPHTGRENTIDSERAIKDIVIGFHVHLLDYECQTTLVHHSVDSSHDDDRRRPR